MKTNKIIASLLALCMVGGTMPINNPLSLPATITASAEEEFTEGTYGDLTYLKYSDHIEISSCDEFITSIDIPAEIDGLPVTVIGEYAFYYCLSLTSIIIPNSITSIGENAFSYCENLTKIAIPDGVTAIGGYAFYNCTSLTSVIIPDSVTSIGDCAFDACKALTKIDVGNGNTVYSSQDDVLFNKDKTEIIKYPKGKLNTSYEIPDSVTIIGDSAFSGCSTLTSIIIPDSVTSIRDSAFGGCSSLTEITIPDNVTSISEGTFTWCESLTEIIIPNSITSIGAYAFFRCSSLTKITIPDSVTNIDSYAFEYCDSLTQITILNPDCAIYDEANTISNGRDTNSKLYYNGTIYGYDNSTAQEYAEKYGYTFVSLGDAPVTPEASYGDADENGTVELADAVLVLCNIIDAESYPMTEQGLLNADVYQSGDGLSNMDALAIQKYLAQLIPALPESYMS